ncbi:MAG: hypothetical protein ACLUSL_11540 [Ruminococcus sp.]
MCASLSVLAPFGEGNSVPVFAVCHAVLQQLLPLSNGVHTRLRVTYGTMAMDLLPFRTRPEEVHLRPGDALRLPRLPQKSHRIRGTTGFPPLSRTTGRAERRRRNISPPKTPMRSSAGRNRCVRHSIRRSRQCVKN